MPINCCFALAFSLLLFASVSWAEPEPSAERNDVVCAQEPSCLTAVSSALETAKTNKNEALRRMLAVYGEFPDPRLCFNLGRLFQQTGAPREAVVHFRKFLDAGVEANPDLLVKARGFLEQAEKDSPPALHPAAVQSAQLAPAITAGPDLAPSGKDTASPGQRPFFRPTPRFVGGAALEAAGILTFSFGIAALLQNDHCAALSTAMTTPQICLQSINTAGAGSGMLISGILGAVGGALLVAMPTRKRSAVAVRWLPAFSTRAGF